MARSSIAISVAALHAAQEAARGSDGAVVLLVEKDSAGELVIASAAHGLSHADVVAALEWALDVERGKLGQ